MKKQVIERFQTETFVGFWKALNVFFLFHPPLFFPFLSQDVQQACQRTEKWAQIPFHCSNIYHFVCCVSACSFTTVPIVLEGHVLSFPLLLKPSVFECIVENEYMTDKFRIIPKTIVAPLKWGHLLVACKLMSWNVMKRRKQVDCMLL